jgi:hypothetical protein
VDANIGSLQPSMTTTLMINRSLNNIEGIFFGLQIGSEACGGCSKLQSAKWTIQ